MLCPEINCGFKATLSLKFFFALTSLEAVNLRMTAYRANFIGSVGFISEIVPCFTWGYGLTCRVGSLYKVYSEEGQKNLRITKGLFQRWEDSPETVEEIRELGEKLAAL